MKSNLLILGMLVTGFVLLASMCGASIVVADVLRDAVSPPQSQATSADARLNASSKCTGLLITGCNVEAKLDQQQEAKQQTAKPSDDAEGWKLLALAMVTIVVAVGGMLWSLARDG